MTGRRFVVIGAGVVGAAVAEELTARGETDVTVLDKGPLYATGGSSTPEALVDGAPSIDASPADLSRFADIELSPAVFGARCDDSYRDVYAVHHPAEGHTSARDLRLAPFATRQRELGAAWFDGAGGWERPRWYEANAPLVEGLPLPERDAWASRHWSPLVAGEHLAVRERGGLFDMTPLTRIEVVGADAEAFLLKMCAGLVDRPSGSVTYTVMLDAAGGIRSDVTVARIGPDRYLLGANGPRDVAWLRAHAPDDVSVDDVTAGTCCLAVWGPVARDALAPLVGPDLDDVTFPYMSVRRLHVGEVPVTAVRISYAGELGWELTASADLGAHLWDTVWAAGAPLGLIAAGTGALAGMRIEKGYRAWGTDLTPEHTPDGAGLRFTVRPDPTFIGAEALSARAVAGSERRLRFLELADDQVAMGGEPVLANDAPVGYVTSAAYGFSVGRSLAYAWLDPSVEVGDPLSIGYFDRWLAATVAPGPAFDPQGLRVRG